MIETRNQADGWKQPHHATPRWKDKLFFFGNERFSHFLSAFFFLLTLLPIVKTACTECGKPDWPFHNLRALKSGDRLILSYELWNVVERILKPKTRPAFSHNLELQNPSDEVRHLHKIRQSPDCEAFKLWKGRSGSCEKVGRDKRKKTRRR